MNKLLAAVSVSAVLVTSQALAFEDWPRWYVGLSGGLTFLDEEDLTVNGTAFNNTDFDMGGAVHGSIGYLVPGTGIRLEAELGYLQADLQTGALDGQAQAFSYMGNVYYDFRNSTPWTPYIGAGAGGARVDFDIDTTTGETDQAFAYQFMGGLAYAPKSIPNTEWNLGYRYFAADDIKSHNAEVGAKFRF